MEEGGEGDFLQDILGVGRIGDEAADKAREGGGVERPEGLEVEGAGCAGGGGTALRCG